MSAASPGSPRWRQQTPNQIRALRHQQFRNPERINQHEIRKRRQRKNGAAHRLHVSGGFVEVNADRVSVLAEIAERPEEIDAARARLAREHAEKTLSAFTGTEEDFEIARARLERNIVRLQLTSASNIHG